jgi:hypothetical protein
VIERNSNLTHSATSPNSSVPDRFYYGPHILQCVLSRLGDWPALLPIVLQSTHQSLDSPDIRKTLCRRLGNYRQER